MKRSFDVVILVAVLIAFLSLNVLLLGRAARVARRTEIVPTPSTYRATPSGTQAVYELLTRLGYRTGRWLEPIRARLPADLDVLVILDPEIYLSEMEAQRLREWVDRGGSLVLACPAPADPASPVRELPGVLFDRRPTVSEPLVGQARRSQPGYLTETGLALRPARVNRYLSGVTELRLDAAASAVPPAERIVASATEMTATELAWPILGDEPTCLATLTTIGAGQVIYLSTSAWFHNQQLGRADNAMFAVNLLTAGVGKGRILFDEYHLGNELRGGLWSLLLRPPLREVLFQLLLGIVLLLVRDAIRFGPVQQDGELPPRRRAIEYVHSLSGLFRRGRANQEVARLWFESTQRRLAAAAGVAGDATDERIAERLGRRPEIDPAAIRELLARLRRAAAAAPGDRELVALATDADGWLRKIERGGRR